jgi:hypothetical protein
MPRAKRYRSPFESFKPFNRVARFKTSTAFAGSRCSKCSTASLSSNRSKCLNPKASRTDLCVARISESAIGDVICTGFSWREAVRSFGAQLCGDVQSHSPFVKGHTAESFCPEHAVNRLLPFTESLWM